MAVVDIIDGCLPQELKIEILLRLPVKSLVNFKLVCKSWNSLISSPDFIKFHTHNSKNNPPITLLYNYNLQVLNSVSLRKRDDNLNPTVLPVNPPLHDYVLKGHLIGSCDGLICTYRHLGLEQTCIYISNPLTKETKEISTPYHIPPGRGCLNIKSVSWFGFVPSINDYMIWLVIDNPIPKPIVHVYSMRDDKWRKLDTSAFKIIGLMLWGTNAVVKNETLYCWFGTFYKDFMVKYDLVQDIMEVVPISLNDKQGLIWYNEPIIGILQDSSVCICKVDPFHMMDVWKLDQYSNSNSWNKLFSLNVATSSPLRSRSRFYFLLGFTSSGGILVRSSSSDCYPIVDLTKVTNELLLIDPNQNSHSPMQLGRIENVLYMLDYVESLVSPFSLLF
ncbi:F-box/kelch-repeat protein At3g23880-like [Spinacia oleracea]|uniref:F-box/kelch-repeat protein At3g23880-like n=1 Tax=Spinacia oleracea TaxID=3562 RepID=A0ABM3R1P6_SPIOL|nr:F-box/kelch-repeat protein At3g23880-like [Spinacia oleracea]